MANEVNRHASAVTRPPRTAVRRVDFRRQMAIVNGEIMRDTEVERAPSQPGRKAEKMRGEISSFNVWISLVS